MFSFIENMPLYIYIIYIKLYILLSPSPLFPPNIPFLQHCNVFFLSMKTSKR